jgi:hypothetical protein
MKDVLAKYVLYAGCYKLILATTTPDERETTCQNCLRMKDERERLKRCLGSLRVSDGVRAAICKSCIGRTVNRSSNAIAGNLSKFTPPSPTAYLLTD